MTGTKSENILVLETGLFPDAGTLEEALQLKSEAGADRVEKISPDEMDDDAWDTLLGAILSARTIVTL